MERNKKMVSWRLDERLVEKLKKEAAAADLTVTQLVEQKLKQKGLQAKLDQVLKILHALQARA